MVAVLQCTTIIKIGAQSAQRSLLAQPSIEALKMCQNWTFKDNFYCKNPLNHFKIEHIFKEQLFRFLGMPETWNAKEMQLGMLTAIFWSQKSQNDHIFWDFFSGMQPGMPLVSK